MRQCYRPKFRYLEESASAKDIFSLFCKEFRFLPDVTAEPDRLSNMVQRLIYKQIPLGLRVPTCYKHDMRMVMLGDPGWWFVKPRQKLSMQSIHLADGDGRLRVARGIFRCPVPVCFVVAPIEDVDYYHGATEKV